MDQSNKPTRKRYEVLTIGDTDRLLNRLPEELSCDDSEYISHQESGLTNAESLIINHHWDAVIIDGDSVDASEKSQLESILQGNPSTRFVLIDSNDADPDVRTVIDAAKNAYARQPKIDPYSSKLAIAQRVRLLEPDFIDVMVQVKSMIENSSSEDGLTRLLSRVGFEKRLHNAYLRQVRTYEGLLRKSVANPSGFPESMFPRSEGTNYRDLRLSVMFMDLDDFKDVNEEYGHLAANKILQQLGVMFSSRELPNFHVHEPGERTGDRQPHMRHEDEAARFGGDEFVALIEAHYENGLSVGRRMCRSVVDYDFSKVAGCSKPLRVGMSAGLAAVALPADYREFMDYISESKPSYKDPLDRADKALLEAKAIKERWSGNPGSTLVGINHEGRFEEHSYHPINK